MELNGYQLIANDPECIIEMLDVASGSISEQDFASWIRENSQS